MGVVDGLYDDMFLSDAKPIIQRSVNIGTFKFLSFDCASKFSTPQEKKILVRGVVHEDQRRINIIRM